MLLATEITIKLHLITSHFANCMFSVHTTHPKPTAVAIAKPNAADLPRPLAAVMTTVLRNVFSDIASTNLSNALP